jgi:hypothetical protein
MTTFEYRHDPTLSQEFVNGAYELGEVKQINIDGHDILYRVGSATLDNSCCGNFGCGYGLVIGEAIGSPHTVIPRGLPSVVPAQAGIQGLSSLVREINQDEPLAAEILKVLMEREALGVVNFYTRTKDVT